MPTNPYFSWFKETREKDLMDSLTVEYVKMFGYDVYYLPRAAVDDDDLFGEDILAKYPNAFRAEVYIDNVEGFAGEGDLFSKFGIQIRDRIKFSMARARWEEMVATEYLEVDSAQVALTDRPMEDDLIYFPLVGKMFEIKHVEHETMFYQLGRRSVYTLECELYEASSERIDTGITDVDAVEDRTSLSIANFVLETEDGDELLAEDGVYLIDEDERPEAVEPAANNELFQTTAPDFVDFSEWNPIARKADY